VQGKPASPIGIRGALEADWGPNPAPLPVAGALAGSTAASRMSPCAIQAALPVSGLTRRIPVRCTSRTIAWAAMGWLQISPEESEACVPDSTRKFAPPLLTSGPARASPAPWVPGCVLTMVPDLAGPS